MYTKCDMKASQHMVPLCNCFEQHDQCHVVKLVERNMISEAKHNNPTITYINLLFRFDLITFTCDFVQTVNTLLMSQEDESCVSS